jgi:hypothetical protein
LNGPDSFSWDQIDNNNSNELAEKKNSTSYSMTLRTKYNADSGGGFMKTFISTVRMAGNSFFQYPKRGRVNLQFHDKRGSLMLAQPLLFGRELLFTHKVTALKSLQQQKEKFFSITMAN